MTMSIAESNSGNSIERSGFVQEVNCVSISGSPESGSTVTMVATTKNVVQEREEELDSCSTSSIGKNSDSSDGGGDSGESEVQSSYKGPLDAMDALQEVLHLKRGISKFYCGKSKSFTSLADASSCLSVKNIAKPENAHTRRRKNLLAHSIFWDKNRNYPMRSNSGGISKRPANSSRSTLALAVTMSSSESNTNSENSDSNSSSLIFSLPPLYPHSRRSPNNEVLSSPPRWKYSPWRSLSLSDLQGAATATTNTTGLVLSNTDKEDKLH
ncbi:protein OXIDATIVE STRESS 3 LIKE 2-like [Cornus florida]|uniref:protein OXIDATIVE STRESS 3 LIKE 2-like n=1 Tax=Cornus florida TaxID=4283 RepID=UPI00289F437F|nr:protein OXIDATIVE STRESS 3 LIKE 2-like [Cornus florida]